MSLFTNFKLWMTRHHLENAPIIKCTATVVAVTIGVAGLTHYSGQSKTMPTKTDDNIIAVEENTFNEKPDVESNIETSQATRTSVTTTKAVTTVSTTKVETTAGIVQLAAKIQPQPAPKIVVETTTTTVAEEEPTTEETTEQSSTEATTSETEVTTTSTTIETTTTSTTTVSETTPSETTTTQKTEWVVFKPSTHYIHRNSCYWVNEECYEIENTEGIECRRCTECNPDMDILCEYVEPAPVYTGTSLDYVTEEERIYLCNTVAYEYGSDWVSLYDKACVVATVMNRVRDGGWTNGLPSTIYNVLTAPNQYNPIYATPYYASNVTQSCIDAVEYYFQHQNDFPHYTSFWGDGRYNYFR